MDSKKVLLIKYYEQLDKNVKLNMEIIQNIVKIDSLKWENQKLKDKLKERENANK